MYAVEKKTRNITLMLPDLHLPSWWFHTQNLLLCSWERNQKHNFNLYLIYIYQYGNFILLVHKVGYIWHFCIYLNVHQIPPCLFFYLTTLNCNHEVQPLDQTVGWPLPRVKTNPKYNRKGKMVKLGLTARTSHY